MRKLPRAQPLVFIDSNVPMYLVGAEHPNKPLAAAILQRLASQGERLVTDAVVFQEILHRYSAIRRTEMIQPAFNVLLGVVDEVFPIDLGCVESAKAVLLAYSGLSSRDAVHLAVMDIRSVKSIVSFDAGFDTVGGVNRIFA